MSRIAPPAGVSIAACCMFASAQSALINYVFDLMAANNSGMSGSGTILLNGAQLTVTVNAAGLVPNQVHPTHIHGLLGSAAPSMALAPPSADTNHDGYVEKPGGGGFRGAAAVRPPPSGTPMGYSTAPGGVISFTQTYDMSNTALYDPGKMGLSLTTTDIEGTTGGNTTPLVDRIFEVQGLGGVPAPAAALDGDTPVRT